MFQALLDSLNGLSSLPVAVIDVRTERELNSDGQIPGTFNIPIAQISKAFALSDKDFMAKYGLKKPSKEDENIVLTCKSGGRAKYARILLKKLGYNKLRVYEGSFNDWTANQGPVCFPNKNTCPK